MPNKNSFLWHHLGQHRPLPVFAALLLACGILLLTLSACGITIGTPAATTTVTGSGISAPVQVAQDSSGSTLVLAKVKIQGQGPFTFAVDTGASTSLISSSLARQLDLQTAGGPQPINGIGGVTQSVPVQISDWSTGPIRLPPMTIASATIPHEHGSGSFQGLLGSDIWSRFGRITLNYSASTLTVPRQIALAPVDWRLARVLLSM